MQEQGNSGVPMTNVRLSVLLLLLGACTRPDRKPADPAPPATVTPAAPAPAVAAPGSLSGTAWRVVRFEGGDGAVLTPSDPDLFTLTFGADGQAAIRADCNRGTGTWTASGSSGLTFGPVASTLALCAQPSIGDRYLRDFEYMRSYVLRDGKLHISLMADGGIWEFEPMAAPRGEFSCGERGTLVATFDNQAQPPTAFITLGGRTVTATSAMAASGARYTAPGFEYWEHQGEVKVTWGNEQFTCRRSDPSP